MSHACTRFFLAFILFASSANAAPAENSSPSSVSGSNSSSNSNVSIDSVLKGGDIPALRNLDYPELQVVPRASDRVQQEAIVEKTSGFWQYWTIESSGLLTLAAGLTHYNRYKSDVVSDNEKRDSNNVAIGAMAVGAGWLGIAYYLYASEPYNTTWNSLKTYRSQDRNDKRTELLRERLAEEGLERPARTIQTLTNLAVFSNLIANGAVLNSANPDTKIVAGVALIGSFLPWMFNNRYVENYNKHLDYKKRIFSPLAGPGFSPVKLADGSWTIRPEVQLRWVF